MGGKRTSHCVSSDAMQHDRMLLVRIAATTALGVASIGCSQHSAACGSAWERSVAGNDIRLWELERVRYPRVETHLIAEVDRCYRPKRPGASLVLAEEWRDKQGNRYLTFDLMGTSDIAFVTVVDRSGAIVRVGEASTNW